MLNPTLFAAIPWDKIVKYGPAIIEMAKKLVELAKTSLRGPDPSTGKVDSHTLLLEEVQRLQKSDLQQAELLEKIAEQLQTVSSGLRVTSLRAGVAFWTAVSGVLVFLTWLLVRT